MTPDHMMKILAFSKTAGYRHDSIPSAINALQEMSMADGNTTMDATESDDSISNLDSLLGYDVLVLVHTTGDFLDKKQLQNLKAFIRDGRGVVGLHAAGASAIENDQWYRDLIGARFLGHPEPSLDVITLAPTVGASSEDWVWFDEWYEFEEAPREGSTLLGWTKATGAPLAWRQDFDGGRCFYTALGHFGEAYEDHDFRAHLWDGIMWAAGHPPTDKLAAEQRPGQSPAPRRITK